MLQWTATCRGDVRFALERKNNNADFVAIGSVDHRSLTGEFKFAFNDSVPLKGKNYYRLRMEDADMKIAYSQQILLDRDMQEFTSLNIVPNPIQGNILQFEINSAQSSKAECIVIDMNGNRIGQQNVLINKGSQAIKIPIEGYRPGVYMLIFNDGNQRISRRFSVQ